MFGTVLFTGGGRALTKQLTEASRVENVRSLGKRSIDSQAQTGRRISILSKRILPKGERSKKEAVYRN